MKKQQDVSKTGRVVTRDELYDAVWTKPLKALAREWSTTHNQLLAACKTMNVPRPNQRYWPLISWGHRVGRKPLPRRSRNTPGELLLSPQGKTRTGLAVGASMTEGERRRERLVGGSEAWFKARRLRRFIRACEEKVRDGGGPRPAGEWPEAWLAWAREQADRLDLMKSGFLEAERERVVAEGKASGPGMSGTDSAS